MLSTFLEFYTSPGSKNYKSQNSIVRWRHKKLKLTIIIEVWNYRSELLSNTNVKKTLLYSDFLFLNTIRTYPRALHKCEGECHSPLNMAFSRWICVSPTLYIEAILCLTNFCDFSSDFYHLLRVALLLRNVRIAIKCLRFINL